MRVALLLLALGFGCSSSGSDKGDCGHAGCECTAEQGCDAGFECPASVDTCVPADCVPGFPDCVCSSAGECTNDHHCQGGICVAGGATSLTSGPESTGPQPTGTSSDPTSSTSPEDSGDPSATMPSETADADATSPPESSSSNTGESPCAGERDCEACLACAIADEGPCAEQHMDCQGNAQCEGLETCASNCASSGAGGQCVNQCCGLFTSGDMPPYSTLSACTNDACGDQCPDFAC